MRRNIDSDYIRKKRYSRRSRDNWRRVKSKGEPQSMWLSDKQIILLSLFLSGIWLMAIFFMAWLAFQ